ncbi:unnamed protein product [Victoria cruziana]
MGLISASLSALWLALRDWLGPRRGRRLVLALPPLVALGYALAFDSYALRLGGSNLVFGLQLLLVCINLAQPPRLLVPALAPASRRWRGVLQSCLLLLALLTFWRGGLAALDTASYPDFYAPHPVNLAAALLANTDGLTGLSNRRAFTERAVEMISMARRYQEPLVLLSLDLDSFKAINEQHGLDAGDRALQLFARCLREQMRLGDLVGRVSGEEFAVLMARSEAQGPQALDLRLRQALAEAAPRELGFALGYSGGWARLRHGDRNIEDLLRRASAALYEAKRLGSNQLLAEPGADQ